jgi:hypothetical protein
VRNRPSREHYARFRFGAAFLLILSFILAIVLQAVDASKPLVIGSAIIVGVVTFAGALILILWLRSSD